jgi:hypothetical protein
MRKQLASLVFLGWAVLWTVSAAAEEIPFLYKGVRPLGMGNAFLTLSDDSNALFYNPAGLNSIQGFGGVEILNPLVEISQVTMDALSDFEDIDTDDTAEVANLLSQYVGDRLHMRTAIFPNAVFHNFGIGVLGQATLDGEVRNRVNPEVNVDGKIDLAGLVGVAYGWMEQSLQVGLVGKFVQRERYTKTYTANDIADDDFDPEQDFEDLSTSDTGFGVDAGVLYHFRKVWLRPTLGMVIQNIGDLDLGESGTLDQRINLGAAVHPDFWVIQSTVAIDVNDVTKNVEGEDDVYKRVHMGAEFRFPKILSLRGGFNQGYRTFGATLDFWILRLEYANYKEEIGAVAGQRDDERQVLQFVLGF